MQPGLEVARLLLDQVLVASNRGVHVTGFLVRLGQRQQAAGVRGVDLLRALEILDRVLVPARQQVERTDAFPDVGRLRFALQERHVDGDCLVVFLLELKDGAQGVGRLDVSRESGNDLLQERLRIAGAAGPGINLAQKKGHRGIDRPLPGERLQRLTGLLEPSGVIIKLGQRLARVFVHRVRLQGHAVLIDRRRDLRFGIPPVARPAQVNISKQLVDPSQPRVRCRRLLRQVRGAAQIVE